MNADVIHRNGMIQKSCTLVAEVDVTALICLQ